MKFKEKKPAVKKTVKPEKKPEKTSRFASVSDDELIQELLSRGYNVTANDREPILWLLKIVNQEGTVKTEKYASELYARRAFSEWLKKVPTDVSKITLYYETGSSSRDVDTFPRNEVVIKEKIKV